MIRFNLAQNTSARPRRILSRNTLLFGAAQALILVSLWALPICAQQLSIRRYDTSDGLAHGVVTSIYQDAKGYLWVSTYEGLSRFDGYRFTNYDTRDGLGDPITNHVTEDREGRLWVATNGDGVARLVDEPASRAAGNGSGSKFRGFRVGDTKESNQVNRMLFDSQNNLWCLTDFGLYRGTMADGDPRLNAVVAQKSGDSNALLEDGQGRLWVGVGHELIEVSRDEVINHGSVGGAGSERINAIIEDRQGRLLVASGYGLFEFSPPGGDGSKQSWRRFPLRLKPGQAILALLEGLTDDLWIGTTAGLIKYKNGQQTEYTAAHGLSGNNIRTLAKDRDGNLWIGTEGGGVSKLGGEMFVSFKQMEGLPPAAIMGTFEDREGQVRAILWDRSIAKITSGEVNRARPLDYPPASSASFTIVLEGPKTYWLGLAGGLTLISKPVLRLRSGREVALASFGPFRAFPVYFLFYEDEKGNLWFSRSEGKDNPDEGPIYRAELAEGRPAAIESFPSGFSCAPEYGEAFMISDRAGGLWLGRTGLLGRLWHGKFSRLQPTEGLFETNPRCFFLDSRGWLWIGMRYGGVSMTKEPGAEQPRFVNYSTEQGLSSSAVRSIAEDDFGRLYLGTDRGLDEFDPSSNSWRHYTRKDGLAGDDVHDLYKDRNGYIWASTSLGVSRLDPRAERRDGRPAPIYFRRVNVAGEDVRLPETGARSIPELELSASRNNLLLEFVALSFQGEDKLRYQYKLDGVDADWVAPTETRSVNYARLAAGSYQFQARAINQEGIVSSEPATFRFRILPPIWQRWWFIGTAAVLAGLLVYSMYRLRVAQLIELERVRMRIATDLHDDIGSSLSRMAILSEVVKRHAGNPPDSVPLLTEIADSARGLISSMRDIVWSVDPRRDDLNSLISRVRQFASDVLEPKGVKWDLEIPSQRAGIKLDPNERQHLFLILKEAINNIARHAECSSVSVSIAIDHSKLKAAVRDDGRGFTPSLDESSPTANEGHGLSNMRVRARQLGGTLVVHSAPGSGTRLDLIIPLKKP